MTPDQQREYQKRQRTRSVIMAVGLLAFVVLIFAISWSKIANGTMH
jgi:hypothetical protein